MYIRLFVNCNCVRERKLKEIPAEYKPYVRYNDNIIYLDYPEESVNKAGEHDFPRRKRIIESEEYDQIWAEWLDHACEHGNGFYVCAETIGSKIRLRPLVRLLERMSDLGLENLTSVVNCSESIEILPEKAAECLVELYQFKSNFPSIKGTVISNEQTGSVLDIILGDEVIPLYSAEGYFIEYDSEGIWVSRQNKQNPPPIILFHSRNFTQDVLPFSASLITDIDSGEYIEIKYPVFPNVNSPYCSDIRFYKRELKPVDLNYLTDPFEKAFKASIETLNPVQILAEETAADMV